MYGTFAFALIVLLHALVAVLAIRFGLHDRIQAINRFEMDVNAGQFLALVVVDVEDPRLGYVRSMIDGVTERADFTLLRVYDLRNGRSEYNLRIDDLYYGAWLVKHDRSSRLGRLYELLRAP